MIDDRHYSVQEVSEMLNVDRQVIYSWIRRKKLRAVKLAGSIIRVPHKELEKFYSKAKMF
jgi:excisionase family DNA binding protein